MSNLIGNAPNQVPTNADLGGLAYQDPDWAAVGNITVNYNLTVAGNISMATGNVTAGNITLNPIGISTSANSVQPKSYTDLMSIVFGV